MIETSAWCDLCGKKIEHGNVITLKTSNNGFSIRYDLCHDCYLKLGAWTEEQRKKNGLEEQDVSSDL